MLMPPENFSSCHLSTTSDRIANMFKFIYSNAVLNIIQRLTAQ
jgi:hypothetical protein